MLLLAALLLTLRAAAALSPGAEGPCAAHLQRLPNTAAPLHYDLTIDADLAEESFAGQVQIWLRLARRSSKLVLHAAPTLTISEAHWQQGEARVRVERLCRAGPEAVVLSLERELEAGAQGVLHLSFAGQFGQDSLGFYKSLETAADSSAYHVALTQFEPSQARRAFPCLDEPALKATFNLTLVHEAQLEALSNTRQLSSELLPRAAGRKPRRRTRFARTPRMSTYLVAFAVGRFQHLERRALHGRVPLRFYAPLGRAAEAEFALDVAARALPLLQDYFQVDFPLDKLDLVCASQFANGAMENWGLIALQTDSVLLGQAELSDSMRAAAAKLVVHELAHQWLGDLVTMDWWNDLWLNEALANWVQYNLTALVLPDLDFDALFFSNAVRGVLEEDLDDKWPAIASRDSKQDASADAFSLMLYDKGSALIKSLHDTYLHPDTFRAALTHYIKSYAYGNAKADDLFRSMELYSSLPVRRFMESWLYQAGYPLLAVDIADGNLRIEQYEFRSAASPLRRQNKSWIVPVSIIFSDGQGRTELAKLAIEKPLEVALPDWFEPETDQHWLKLNAKAAGLYHVKYSKRLLKALRRPIQLKLMETLDRQDILFNLKSLLAAGHTIALRQEELVQFYLEETDAQILGELLSTFEVFEESRELLPLYKSALARLVNLRDSATTEAEARQVDSQLLEIFLQAGYKPANEQCLSMIRDVPLDSISEPMQTMVLYVGLFKGSDEQKRQVQSMVKKMNEGELKIKYLEMSEMVLNSDTS